MIFSKHGNTFWITAHLDGESAGRHRSCLAKQRLCGTLNCRGKRLITFFMVGLLFTHQTLWGLEVQSVWAESVFIRVLKTQPAPSNAINSSTSMSFPNIYLTFTVVIYCVVLYIYTHVPHTSGHRNYLKVKKYLTYIAHLSPIIATPWLRPWPYLRSRKSLRPWSHSCIPLKLWYIMMLCTGHLSPFTATPTHAPNYAHNIVYAHANTRSFLS